MSGEASRYSPEFPDGASDPASLSRKEFLRLMGASLALAGAGACTRPPPEKIVPYVRQPEGLTPGEAQWYATAMELGPNSYGLLVKSNEGRPTKIEGNPGHPMSLGRTGIHAQAALLDLYDPDRSQVVRHRGKPSTWEDFLAALLREQAKWKSAGGEGVVLLTGRSNSLFFRSQVSDFQTRYPKAISLKHDAAFPIDVPRIPYDLDKADLIVSFDADFLGGGDPHETARFVRRRQEDGGRTRLIVLESMPSLTGAMADRRFAVHPQSLREIAAKVGELLQPSPDPRELAELSPADEQIVRTLLRELRGNRTGSVVMAGEHQSGWVHRLVQDINHALGNQLGSVYYSTDTSPDELRYLTRLIESREVSALLVLDCNPLFTLPGDLDFPRLPPGTFSVHAGQYFDETAAYCEWHIPLSHLLESWSDTNAIDQTRTIVQPLIEPLYATKSKHEFLAALNGSTSPAYELLRNSWKETEPAWRKALHDGFHPPQPPASGGGEGGDFIMGAMADSISKVAKGRLCVLIRPDPHLLDGRFANNAWLQELPKPFTRLTWGNAIHVSPSTAAHFKLKQGDEVELVSGDRVLRGPIWILPGHADHCATIHLGGGRTRAGRVGNGVGYDASFLQTFESPWLCDDVEIRATGKKHVFATTQHQHDMAGGHPVRVVEDGAKLARSDEKLESLYPAVQYTSPSWGMVIDLNTCTGCGTCTLACQAENNIPVVGRDEVLRGRVMHWIRVDQYIEGSDHPRYLHQPVPCMHCENAPCEVVCPVAATVHDHQGLNVMVYNRCIGTRYCANNCPYKVRRFNFFQYADLKSPQLKLQRNPDVTVRERGVMEKCTYCVQRITAARITADVENRPIRDGEVVPACAQACPANAIAFGDIMDPASKVSAARRDPRHYALLEELNTRPRTTYLARVINPEVTK